MANPNKPTNVSLPPQPPRSGGNLKYVVIGLIFLGTAGGLLFVANKKAPPPPAPEKPPEVARVNPLEQQQLELEEPPPEPATAGEPAPVPAKPVRRPAGGEWECSGDLPGARKVIDSYYAQIRSCYERRLKVNNILQGDLKLKIKVGSGGKVVAAAVSGSMRDPEVFNCVRNLAQTWTFPVPTGGACAVVQVPFAFAPKEG